MSNDIGIVELTTHHLPAVSQWAKRKVQRLILATMTKYSKIDYTYAIICSEVNNKYFCNTVHL